MTQEKIFDVDAWKKNGEDALKELKAKRDDLLDQLDAINGEIEKIEMVLGGDGMKPSQRPRIKPVLVEILRENKEIEIDDLVKLAQKKLRGVSVDSIKTSLRRTASNLQWLTLDGDTVKYAPLKVPKSPAVS